MKAITSAKIVSDFGKDDAEEHVGAERAFRFRVAADRLQGAAHEDTDTNAGADRAQTDRQTRREQSCSFHSI